MRFSQRHNHILLSLMDMVQNARCSTDLNYVYDLTLTLIQYGANANVSIDSHGEKADQESCQRNQGIVSSRDRDHRGRDRGRGGDRHRGGDDEAEPGEQPAVPWQKLVREQMLE